MIMAFSSSGSKWNFVHVLWYQVHSWQLIAVEKELAELQVPMSRNEELCNRYLKL